MTEAIVHVQNPIELPDIDSEPQPDVALLRTRADFYTTAHPRAADVLLVTEVADSSARPDRRVKIPLYARAGIREVWLVDVVSRRVELYREPSADGYLAVRAAGRRRADQSGGLPGSPVDSPRPPGLTVLWQAPSARRPSGARGIKSA